MEADSLGLRVDTGVVQPHKHAVLRGPRRHHVLVAHGVRPGGEGEVAGGFTGHWAAPEWHVGTHLYPAGDTYSSSFIWKTSSEN